MAVNIFWFRRDLRLSDNAALFHALQDNLDVYPIFIFDSLILDKLSSPKDKRVSFIYKSIADLKKSLNDQGRDLNIYYGNPIQILPELCQQLDVQKVYTNQDYEPYARKRDDWLKKWSQEHNVQFLQYKDQVIFEKNEILTSIHKPYTVYTPYKKKWLSLLKKKDLQEYNSQNYLHKLLKQKPSPLIALKELGFEWVDTDILKPVISKSTLKNYSDTRNYPYLDNGTTHLGVHLRFGTVSIRQATKKAMELSEAWLSELIWREFFMQILWHFPETEKKSFRPEYDRIAWDNSKENFEKWKLGFTGYPLVDAGMRELLHTGYMHNRVRMLVASFLTKHLLTHWKLGERHFAGLLLDFDLSANVGNWQWAAGSGCDAAPYFRVFNPMTQQEKFDPHYQYIQKWVPEYSTPQYPQPIVEHSWARQRALREFSKAVKQKKA